MRDKTKDVFVGDDGTVVFNSAHGVATPDGLVRYVPRAQLVERDERIADLERQLAEVTAVLSRYRARYPETEKLADLVDR